MRSKKPWIVLSVLLLCVVLLAGCGVEKKEILSLQDMQDMTLTVAVPDDINATEPMKRVCPNVHITLQNDTMFGVRSVSEGKVDAFAVGRVYIQKAIDEGNFKNIRILDEPLITYQCALGISTLCKIPGFEGIINDTMNRYIADGTIDEMQDRWFIQENMQMPEIRLDAAPSYTLNAVTYGQCKPYSFVADGKLTGFDVELLYRICRDNHWGLNLSSTEYQGMLMGLSTGKFDLISANLYVTEDRTENVVFSVPYETQDISLAVRDYSGSLSGGAHTSFADTVKAGLRKTFVAEDRWKMILTGLGTTLLITLGGFILANILGAVFCAFAMSKKKGLRIVTDVYDRIMQGTPMVVILMIFYYVIFGRSTVSGVWVAIFAFGLSSGASLARQFQGAIAGVGKDQIEAALALGFTGFKTFCGIILPQAARTALPGYFSEIINLMKGTAIVGYITVVDLTKSGDLIRSSTYDAFFPLLSIACIYFLISFGILCLMKCLLKKFVPKRVTAQQEVKK